MRHVKKSTDRYPDCPTERVAVAPSIGGVQHTDTKEGGLIREYALTLSLHFTRAVFRQPRPLPEGALRCRWPADDCIVYYSMGGITGDNFIVYDFPFVAARWTVQVNFDSCGILSYMTLSVTATYGITPHTLKIWKASD